MQLGQNFKFGKNGIVERPKCAIPECENKAIVLYGNKFICGKCLRRMQEIEREEVERRMNKINEEIKNKNYGEQRFS